MVALVVFPGRRRVLGRRLNHQRGRDCFQELAMFGGANQPLDLQARFPSAGSRTETPA